MEVLFSSYIRLIENIVGIIRMNLRLKKHVLIPANEMNITLPGAAFISGQMFFTDPPKGDRIKS